MTPTRVLPPSRPRVARLGPLAAAVALLASPGTAGAEGGVRKGPWLMEPRADGITVMLERDAPGPVTVRAFPQSDPGARAPAAEVRSAAGTTLHEVRLAGLAPGAWYRYEVTGPGLAAAVGGTFVTSPADAAAPFRFVVYGDTRTDATVHGAIARALTAERAEFALHTGDLINDGRNETEWQEFFDIERDFLRSTPFVPVIGNHEIANPGSTGVDNYRRYVHCDPDAPEPELDYVLAYGNVRVLAANAYSDWAAPAVRTWLEARLARARAEVPRGFVIVLMHWGISSSGPHGENHFLRAAGIRDVFRRHRVDLVIGGHDHLYERGEDDGLRFMVTGGGGAPVYDRSQPRAATLGFAPENHYVRADVEAERIVFTAVRPDGSVIERCPLRASGWDCAPTVARRAPPAAGAPPTVVAASTAGAPPVAGGRDCGCRAAGASGPARPVPGVLLAGAAVGGLRARRRRRRAAASGILPAR